MPHDVMEANRNLAEPNSPSGDPAEPTYESWAARVVLERLRIVIPIASIAAVGWALLAAKSSARLDVWVASGASTALAAGAFVALTRSAAAGVGLAVCATAIASGAFAATFGGLQSVAAAGLITPWVFGAVIVPQRLFLLPAVLACHAAAFVLTSWLLGGAPLREPAVLIIAGVALVIVTAGAARRRNYDRRDFEAWVRFRETLKLVELRRAELQQKTAALEESARLKVAETLAHAKTTRALEEELSRRVASRSRRLASAVDRASSPELSGFGSLTRDALVGARAKILDRMTPAPYEPSFLAIDRTQPARRLLVSGVELPAPLGARLVEELTKAPIDHPSLARIVDAGTLEDKAVFWAAEHRPGAPLFRSMPRADFGTWDAARITQAAAAALADAHDRGVFHLGLDPYRIVLSPTGSGLTIHGAGLVQACTRATSAPPRSSSSLRSTPAYRAPEQCANEPLDDPSADTYALGLLLFEMIAKLHPLVAGLSETGLGAAQALREIVPETPAPLATLVEAMLAYAPGDRPALREVDRQLGRLADLGGALTVHAIAQRLAGSTTFRPPGKVPSP